MVSSFPPEAAQAPHLFQGENLAVPELPGLREGSALGAFELYPEYIHWEESVRMIMNIAFFQLCLQGREMQVVVMSPGLADVKDTQLREVPVYLETLGGWQVLPQLHLHLDLVHMAEGHRPVAI